MQLYLRTNPGMNEGLPHTPLLPRFPSSCFQQHVHPLLQLLPWELPLCPFAMSQPRMQSWGTVAKLWISCWTTKKFLGPGFYSSCSRYTVLPAAFPLLIIQKLASCRTSALHGHLYFLSHPWLSVHLCHLISTTQHCSFHPWVTSDT